MNTKMKATIFLAPEKKSNRGNSSSPSRSRRGRHSHHLNDDLRHGSYIVAPDGAGIVLNHKEVDVVAEVKKLTDGGADVSIEASGTQEIFESSLRCLRLGGILSVYLL